MKKLLGRRSPSRATAERLGIGESPVRVAFFAMWSTANISTRTWCERPTREMGHLGVEGRLFAPASRRVEDAFLRRELGSRPARLLLAAVYWYGLVLPRRVVQILRASRYDAIFLQRSLLRYDSRPFLERLLELVCGRIAGRPIVYHLDDALWAVSKRANYVTRCRIADRVITGNDLIAEFAAQAGATVDRVEWAVDVSRYRRKQHRSSSGVVIGYSASSPESYLGLVGRPLAEVCERTHARVRVVGGARCPPVAELEGHMEWTPWRISDQYSLFDAFDIGIMPLYDTEHDRGKEPCKIKEYMAAGLPIVAHPVGHNLTVMEDGTQGFFAATEADWVERLEELITDPELRAEMGAAGRCLVEDRYDLSEMFRSLALILRGQAVSRSGSNVIAREAQGGWSDGDPSH